MKSPRQGYADGLVELGRKIVVLTADVGKSLKLEEFQKKFPDRFFNFGIAEQNMMSAAAGLAISGEIPFVSGLSIFTLARAWEQLRIIALSNLNVKIGGSHSGLSNFKDGATHQMLEDIALTRVLPNLTVIVPCDYFQTKRAVIEAAKIKGPVYIRFSRNEVPTITAKRKFEIKKAEILREGKDVAIIACGNMVFEALKAAENLSKRKISAMVINLHTIKPIDKKTILRVAYKTKAIVTAEEHQIVGGLGSAVAEVLAQTPFPIVFVGVKDKFGQCGKLEELMREYGLTSKDIEKAVKKVIKLKKCKRLR